MVSLSADSPGYVAYNLEGGIGMDFDITMKMRTLAVDSLLVYTGNTDPSLVSTSTCVKHLVLI